MPSVWPAIAQAADFFFGAHDLPLVSGDLEAVGYDPAAAPSSPFT